MLDQYGRFPDVPHDLADELFGRVIARLAAGDLVGYGRWGFRSEFEEIEAEHWLTSSYNIWFNELGYADGGKVGYSGICVEARSSVVAENPPQEKRGDVKRFFKDWCEANPGVKINRAKMLQETRSQLSEIGTISENMFNSLWRDEFPTRQKYKNRPPSA
ncbi:MAG: hypothetical protein CL955_05005 [Erythrobacteraceae bacterium]|nr:hypothetical protein [Erythrobacteraceae bacterium]